MSDVINSVFKRYKQLVSENPETVGQIEACSRVISYIIAGRFAESQVLSELVYMSSNVLVFLNDQILKGASKLVNEQPVIKEKIRTFLTVLQYAEVFIEIAAQKFWGEPGRWLLIVCVQILKTALRLFLLWNKHGGIQTSPPILPLDRDAFIQNQLKTSTEKELNEFEESIEVESEGAKHSTFNLKRSGRTMRKLSAAPPMNFRSWKVPKEHSVVDDNFNRRLAEYLPSPLSKQRLWAETLYVVKPILHLISLKLFGMSSWKPWLISAGSDVASLYMHGEPEDLNPNEKSEIRRRTMMMLLYILRSPFYDNYSKLRVLFVLRILSENVPLVGMLLNPLIDYLPYWQRVYFYLWSS